MIAQGGPSRGVCRWTRYAVLVAAACVALAVLWRGNPAADPVLAQVGIFLAV